MKRYATTVFVGLFLTVVSTMAQAITITLSYDGSICVPVGSNNGGYTVYGIHNNSATEELNVVCPLPRRWGGDNLDALTNIQVAVFDRHPTSNFSCTLLIKGFSLSNPGNFTIAKVNGNDSFFSASSDANRKVIGGQISVEPFQQTLFGQQPLLLQCTIPPIGPGGASHLDGIRITGTGV